MNLKFMTGTQLGYNNMSAHDEGTFYFTGTNVYLGDIKLSSDADLAEALALIASNADAIDALSNKIGSLENLNTSNKSDIVAAINEVLITIGTNETNSTIHISETSDNNYAQVYTVYQGNNYIGTINIPRDMVVESGVVEINPEGQPEGTYIVLTLANTGGQKIYIDVADLVSIYTVAKDATQVQLAVNDTEISATLVAGGVGTTELADDAVTTAKIADGNVTTAKLSTTVQGDLELAESAVQSVTDGILNGTIMVDGTSVAVAGLGSAAYEAATAFDTAGSASTAEQNAKDYADSLLTWIEY